LLLVRYEGSRASDDYFADRGWVLDLSPVKEWSKIILPLDGLERPPAPLSPPRRRPQLAPPHTPRKC
jgi:hypothetical protein